MYNRCVSTDCNSFIAKPSNALANIIYIFACNCHNNIVFDSKFLFLCFFFAYKTDGLINKQTILRINLTIVNTRNAVLNIILFLKITTS